MAAPSSKDAQTVIEGRAAQKPGAIKSMIDANIKEAPRSVLEDLFEDYFTHRYRIYKLNFIKGIFFGFGSVLGGTVMIAVLIWALSFFDQLPFVGDFVNTITNSIESARPQ